MRERLGYIAIALSFLIWAMMAGVPFLPIGPGRKVLVAAVLYGLSYVFFFLGAWLVGPKVMQAMKARMRGWWRRLRGQVEDTVQENDASESPVAETDLES